MQRFLLALVVSVACAGCLRSTTTIDLRPDGSGTILQETGISAQALAMLKSMAASQQGGKDSPADMFTEEQARRAAETMGVTFVSGEPFKTATLEGYRARYSFADITKVKVNMNQGASSMTAARQPPFSFAFDKGAAESTLTIQMPEQTPGKGPLAGLPGAGTGGGTDADKAQAAQALAMMKMMMAGLFVDVSLNVNGRIIKSNAPLAEGSKVTLLQIDFDKLLADEAALQQLQGASDLKSLSQVPGLKVPAESKVTIVFSR